MPRPSPPEREIGSLPWTAGIVSLLAATVTVLALALGSTGCASGRIGLLRNPEPLRPTAESTAAAGERAARTPPPYYSLFGVAEDTTVGFQPDTADTTRRFLGRLKYGYVADTLNLFLFGDNRPAYRSVKFRDDVPALRGILSLNPVKFVRGVFMVPWMFFKGTFSGFALWRDIPDFIGKTPKYGREHQVMNAMVTHVDSLEAHGQTVAAVINTGDLVQDGRRPAQWMRFLRITRPLSSRVPYFPIAGNHEKTFDPIALENWRAATGLPIASDRLYYCFDSADGWVRFVALDSNPMVDPENHWSREVEVAYSDEQITWAVARIKEHAGPAIVFLHHPPFSLGYHRSEWQLDPVMLERRTRLVSALQQQGLSVIVAGHEHAYERALLRSGDAVMVVLDLGGGGSPLITIPTGGAARAEFAQYEVAGSQFRADDVFAAIAFHFVHLRIWFGGGEFTTYAVDAQSKTRVIDHVQIDLARYGVPKVDQFKIPIVQSGPKQGPEKEVSTGKVKPAKTDSLSATQRIEAEPPPGKKAPRRTRRR